MLSGRREALPVYVATDDISTVDELRACPEAQQLDWRITHAQSDPSRGIEAAVTYRLWAEMTLLAHATWVVGTFSSNVGRLVQVLRTQEEASFQSVDTPRGWSFFPR